MVKARVKKNGKMVKKKGKKKSVKKIQKKGNKIEGWVKRETDISKFT